MLDILGRAIDLWDIIIVVSANCKMELALVVSQVDEDGEITPIICRFNDDGSLRKRETPFRRQAVLGFPAGIPQKYLDTRNKYMEEYCD